MRILILLTLAFYLGVASAQSSFLDDQKRYPRVRAALVDKRVAIDETLAQFDLSAQDLNILLLATKHEAILQLWAKKRAEQTFRLIKTYPIVASSGEPGPKSAEGDHQVPEGFYLINRFNPQSQFWLSLGLNYPNLADRIRSAAPRLGGDIFIHGSFVTVGCLPITDDKIQEVYLYAVYARSSGQRHIPVYLFPFAMNAENMEDFERRYADRPELIAFWRNLKQGYDLFANTHTALKVRVADDGQYQFR